MSENNPNKNRKIKNGRGDRFLDGPPPPGDIRFPFGSHPFSGPFPHFKPPLPLTRESFKEVRFFMVLMILSDNPKGITGYQLQERFNFPRGNILRLLDDLVESEHVITKESVIDGRANKFFIITEKGTKFLNDLKKKWADRFAQMSQMAAPGIFGGVFIKKALNTYLNIQLDQLDSKEDALDLVRGIRSTTKTFLKRINERLNDLKFIKSELDNTIEKIEEMQEDNVEDIKKLIKDFGDKVEDQL
jgi:DNA-binding PadR family transcriptional regulator